MSVLYVTDSIHKSIGIVALKASPSKKPSSSAGATATPLNQLQLDLKCLSKVYGEYLKSLMFISQTEANDVSSNNRTKERNEDSDYSESESPSVEPPATLPVVEDGEVDDVMEEMAGGI